MLAPDSFRLISSFESSSHLNQPVHGHWNEARDLGLGHTYMPQPVPRAHQVGSGDWPDSLFIHPRIKSQGRVDLALSNLSKPFGLKAARNIPLIQ